MIFRKLLNAAFRFSLRRPEAEIMGAFNPPPPSRRWKIQRPSRARVKISFILLIHLGPGPQKYFFQSPSLGNLIRLVLRPAACVRSSLVKCLSNNSWNRTR